MHDRLGGPASTPGRTASSTASCKFCLQTRHDMTRQDRRLKGELKLTRSRLVRLPYPLVKSSRDPTALSRSGPIPSHGGVVHIPCQHEQGTTWHCKLALQTLTPPSFLSFFLQVAQPHLPHTDPPTTSMPPIPSARIPAFQCELL